MKKLIGKDAWMKSTVHQNEIERFDPRNGMCCEAANFRIHLDGTPANPWNKSATAVFVAKFLATYPGTYPSDSAEVVDMVHAKTRAVISSLIKDYRLLQKTEVRHEMNNCKKRRERKRLVSTSILTYLLLILTCASFLNAVVI